jgi:hypothetical protein
MMSRRPRRIHQALLLAFCVSSMASLAVAQDTPMVPIRFHPQKEARADGPAPDRFEIYAGYGYFHPVRSDIANYPYQPLYNPNATVSMTGYFSRHFGVQVEGGFFSGPNSDVLANQCRANGFACLYRDPSYYTAEAGPVARVQFGRFVPFIHVLGGGAKISGPVFQPLTWGYAGTGGVGVDYILPFWHDRIAIRPIQADYHYSHVDYGPQLSNGLGGGLGIVSAFKLSGGLVARFGGMGSAPQQVTLACPVTPATIYPGEPLSVMAQPLNLVPGRKATYTWTTTGGKLTAGEGGASIDTAGLPPGDYTITGHVTQGRKAMQSASCQGMFTIRAYEPPTISCTATPSTVQPGGSSTIASNGFSPQGRQLTYMYTSSSGTIVGNGATGALSTAGVPPGTINITCSLLDDLGKTASATTTVTVTSPPAVMALPTTQSLCSVSFERDRRRPVRVDNEAKACLDDIALNLNRDPQAKIVVVGRYSTDEQPLQGEQRSVNVQTYLLEKGIDGGRIDLRLGDQTGRTVDSVLVPVGATYTDVGTTFDSASVHPPTYYAAPQRRTARTRRHTTRHKTTRKVTHRKKKAATK